MRLNLGCGARIKPATEGWVNVDIARQEGVDLVHDLDRGPWPIVAETATEIEAKDIFEHVWNPILFMVECHRVLKPDAILHLHTPYYRSIDAFTDPTHRRFPTEHTFDYWIPGRLLYTEHNAAYGGVAYTLLDMHLDQVGSLDVTLQRIGRSVAWCAVCGPRPVDENDKRTGCEH